MWGTSSPDDKLTDDLGNAIEGTRISGRRWIFLTVEKLAPSDLGTFATKSATSGLMHRSKPGRPATSAMRRMPRWGLNAQKSLILAPNVNRLDTTFEKWPVSTAAQFKPDDWPQANPPGTVAIATGRFTSKLPNWARV